MSLTYIDQTAPVLMACTFVVPTPVKTILELFKDWRCGTGRPRQTWLRTVEDDLRPLNFVLVTARRSALDRWTWHQLNGVGEVYNRLTNSNTIYYKCR